MSYAFPRSIIGENPLGWAEDDMEVESDNSRLKKTCKSENRCLEKINLYWLVVWNIFYFSILGIIIPTDSYFSGVETTNQL